MTLDDYLRRRTNIAQWVPRGGLGRADKHLPTVREIAHTLYEDPDAAERAVEQYRASTRAELDPLLGDAPHAVDTTSHTADETTGAGP